jgi:hypothetical protein
MSTILKAMLLGTGMAALAAAQAHAGTITCSSQSGAQCEVGRTGASCILFRGGLEHKFVIDTDAKQMECSTGGCSERIQSAFHRSAFHRVRYGSMWRSLRAIGFQRSSTSTSQGLTSSRQQLIRHEERWHWRCRHPGRVLRGGLQWLCTAISMTRTSPPAADTWSRIPPCGIRPATCASDHVAYLIPVLIGQKAKDCDCHSSKVCHQLPPRSNEKSRKKFPGESVAAWT